MSKSKPIQSIDGWDVYKLNKGKEGSEQVFVPIPRAKFQELGIQVGDSYGVKIDIAPVKLTIGGGE